MNDLIELNEFRTDFLISSPDIWVGAGSTFNIAGNYFSYNTAGSADEADENALRSDWGVISQDLQALRWHLPDMMK